MAFPSGSSTSLSLIARAQIMDPSAWDRLCAVYGPLVYRWARIVGLQDCDAADVGQDVFRTVVRKIAAFDHTRPGATFRGWLKTITRNKIGDLFRKQEARGPLVGGTTGLEFLKQIPDELSDTDASHPGYDAETDILRRTLDSLRSEFEPRTWQAFWRVTVEEQPINEVASNLGMTKHAVRQAKYRVLRRLRVELGQIDDFS